MLCSFKNNPAHNDKFETMLTGYISQNRWLLVLVKSYLFLFDFSYPAFSTYG